MVVAYGDTMIIGKVLKAVFCLQSLQSGGLLHEVNVLDAREMVNKHCCITALESEPALSLGNESQFGGLQLINRKPGLVA